MQSTAGPLLHADEYRDAGYWGDDTFRTYVDHWADSDPDRLYLSDGDVRRTFGQFRTAAWNLAASFARLGVVAGDRIAVQLPNWNEFFLTYAACSAIGAVIVPVVPVYRHNEVAFIVENSGAVGLVVPGTFRKFDHAAMAREIVDSASGANFVIVVRGEPDVGETARSTIAFDSLLSESGSTGDAGPGPSADDDHAILYSSGTESRPKGCLHTWNSSSFLPKQAVAALGMNETDVVFMPSPVTHALGLTLGVMAPMLAGAAVVLLDIFEPTTALERISSHGCTGTASPAPFIRMMLDHYDPEVHDLSRLRFWLSAGAPIPTALVHEAGAVIPACRVVSAYGSSEVMLATVCRTEDPPERSASSDGRPVPGVTIRIVDAEGLEVATGVDGQIGYRGPGRLIEYWHNPELTRHSVTDDGYWLTGDLGHVDADGYLRVTGRAKDIIIRGGFNVSAREVEEALLTHPRISNVAVIGLPDAIVGERVCAVVVTRDSAVIGLPELLDHLTNHCRISIWKVPERVEVVDDLPVTATGKIQKFALRARYGEAAVAEQ